jgi:hypothetical protein
MYQNLNVVRQSLYVQRTYKYTVDLVDVCTYVCRLNRKIRWGTDDSASIKAGDILLLCESDSLTRLTISFEALKNGKNAKILTPCRNVESTHRKIPNSSYFLSLKEIKLASLKSVLSLCQITVPFCTSTQVQ